MKFYKHTPNFANTPYSDVEYYNNKVSFDGPICSKCGRYLEQIGKWIRPHEIMIMGTNFGDVMYGVPDIFSQKFKDWYENSGLCGNIKFDGIDNVIIKESNIKPDHISQFYTIKAPMSRVKIDWRKTISDAVWHDTTNDMNCSCWPEKPIYVMNTKGGLHLDLTDYDGEDVFEIFQPRFTFFSQNFIDKYLESGIQGLQYESLNSYNMFGAMFGSEPTPLRKLSKGVKGYFSKAPYK